MQVSHDRSSFNRLLYLDTATQGNSTAPRRPSQARRSLGTSAKDFGKVGYIAGALEDLPGETAPDHFDKFAVPNDERGIAATQQLLALAPGKSGEADDPAKITGLVRNAAVGAFEVEVAHQVFLGRVGIVHQVSERRSLGLMLKGRQRDGAVADVGEVDTHNNEKLVGRAVRATSAQRQVVVPLATGEAVPALHVDGLAKLVVCIAKLLEARAIVLELDAPLVGKTARGSIPVNGVVAGADGRCAVHERIAGEAVLPRQKTQLGATEVLKAAGCDKVGSRVRHTEVNEDARGLEVEDACQGRRVFAPATAEERPAPCTDYQLTASILGNPGSEGALGGATQHVVVRQILGAVVAPSDVASRHLAIARQNVSLCCAPV
eukprot:m.52459 g.52459  ORF g.52459 m.52459 type:complete len:377 (-) comp6697_c0_seq1:102-1232(-)